MSKAGIVESHVSVQKLLYLSLRGYGTVRKLHLFDPLSCEFVDFRFLNPCLSILSQMMSTCTGGSEDQIPAPPDKAARGRGWGRGLGPVEDKEGHVV